MRNRFSLFVLALFAVINLNVARAQTAPNPAFRGSFLLPAKPTSADNIVLSLSPRTCARGYAANRYSVSMALNHITVKLGEQGPPIPIGVCPGEPRDEIDLGKLPAGNYTVTVIESANGVNGFSRGNSTIQNAPFTVADARVIKQKPWVSLDYTGMWWDPADPGTGLFVWQDAADNTLITWFTYGADGKPTWYVFQPKWGWYGNDTLAATELVLTERKPGTTVAPPGPTSSTAVGTAWINFATSTNLAPDGTTPILTGADYGPAGTAKFEITLKGQAPRVITIQRFKP
jgi:hypothetical protein